MNRNPAALVTIAMMPVKSSQLSAIGYDEATRTLQVDFTGSPQAIYQYHEVPATLFEDMKAEQIKKDAGDPKASVGSIFYGQVHKKIPFTRFNKETGAVEKRWPDEPQAAYTAPEVREISREEGEKAISSDTEQQAA